MINTSTLNELSTKELINIHNELIEDDKKLVSWKQGKEKLITRIESLKSKEDENIIIKTLDQRYNENWRRQIVDKVASKNKCLALYISNYIDGLRTTEIQTGVRFYIVGEEENVIKTIKACEAILTTVISMANEKGRLKSKSERGKIIRAQRDLLADEYPETKEKVSKDIFDFLKEIECEFYEKDKGRRIKKLGKIENKVV